VYRRIPCSAQKKAQALGEKSMSHTLSLELPEELHKSLLEKAKQAGKSPEAFAVQLLASATATVMHDPLEQFIGAFSSHGSDWADEHDTYLGRSAIENMPGEEREGHTDA
jgi:hypothetical protein